MEGEPRRFPDIEAFYLDDERRRGSGEMDFGAWWWDGPQGYSGCWALSVVKDTGELYVRLRSSEDVGETVVLLGHVVADPEAVYDEAEKLLDGWEQVCGASSALQWVIARVGHQPLSFLIRATRQGGHVHVSLWCGRNAGSRGRAGELSFRVDEWPVFRDALLAGMPGQVEVEEEQDGAPALAVSPNGELTA